MDWIVLLPPTVAIGLALWTRQVYLSLVVGLWIGTTILGDGNPIFGLRLLADVVVGVFADASNARIVLFSLMVGGLIALVQVSGGVGAFTSWMQERGWASSRRRVELMAWATGMLVFVESSITSLTVGTVCRPFFDRLRLPREKLAYYCDATSAPVCMMIPLNGWGAFVLGLLAAQGLSEGAVPLLASSLVFNFFCVFAVVFALFLAVTGWGVGRMRRAERRAMETGAVVREGSVPMIADEVVAVAPLRPAQSSAVDFLGPIFVMIVMIFVGLCITGEGRLMQGSGSEAVLWAVGTAIGVAMLYYVLPRPFKGGTSLVTLKESSEYVVKGASGLVGVVGLLVLAFALGTVSRQLEMGPYIVGLIGDQLPVWWIPSVVFAAGCVISFTLGSSWTTFAVLIPLAMPLAEGLGLSQALMLGAVLSGGVYGDHASPLSDTSIISSMSSACDHVDHINTQLPYTLGLAGVSFIAFLIAGLVT